MESLKLRVKAFKEENDSNNLTLGPSLRDSVTKVWPEMERLSHIFAVTPFIDVVGKLEALTVNLIYLTLDENK